MSNIFQKLEFEAFRAGITPRTKESMNWFRQKAQAMGKVSRAALMKEEPVELKSRGIAGNMYMYFYDPKTKEKLPYYDSFPLVVVVGPAPGGFAGINLHYLNYNVRAQFLDELMGLGPSNPRENSRLRKIRYNLLKSTRKFKEFKPCFKHYLGKHVKSQFALVPMTEWEIAIFLPIEQFKKKGKQAVWRESLKIARR